jgi:hypothetical protein
VEERTLLITTRGMRVVYVLEGLVVGIVALILGSGGSGAGEVDDTWRSLPPAEGLAAAPCPEPGSVEFGNLNEERLAAAREGEFEVFGDEPTRLEVPVDWADDPLAARRYRQNLHKLRFLEPLLVSYRDTTNTEDLAQALALASDWVEQNPRKGNDAPLEAWQDKVTGDRVPFLAYLLRAAACEGLGTSEERNALLASMEEHGSVLAADGKYIPDNHGLFVDLGLVRLANFFPFLPEAPAWRSAARERFEETLRGRLAGGFWLEHSTAYQFLVIRALERMLADYGADPDLEGLLAELRNAGAWLVKPDGEMTQFGDSDREQVPEWAPPLTEEEGLLTALDAGFAIVRAPGPEGEMGYLAVTDGFHNLTHKHADELSFELFDEGTDIVTDTGLYDKDPGPIRDFVVSNRAHSTLTVDGLDLPVNDGSLDYGSGLTATGAGDGWYAIEGKNRLLADVQGVEHRRLFLYRPGEMLVIVDQVDSDLTHTYNRYLQLGRDIEPGEVSDAEAGSTVPLAPIDGEVADGPGTVTSSVSEARGQEEPLQGFTSPSFRRLIPRSTLAYTATGGSETFLTTIALDTGLSLPAEVEWQGSSAVLTFDDGRTVEVGGSDAELTVADD